MDKSKWFSIVVNLIIKFNKIKMIYLFITGAPSYSLGRSPDFEVVLTNLWLDNPTHLFLNPLKDDKVKKFQYIRCPQPRVFQRNMFNKNEFSFIH